MAKLEIKKYGDEVLRKPCKEVGKISSKIQKLTRDMLDTMYANNGVGLAAPQVGLNLRIFVIDVSNNDEPLNPLVFINPKIISKSGAIIHNEGCLSFPEVYTDVLRCKNVKIKAFNEKGKPFVMEAKDGTLLAIAIQHEFDHLNGVLFIDHTTNRFSTDAELQSKGLPAVDPNYLLEEKELGEELKKQNEGQ